MSFTGEIFRIKKYALHDGPGIRTTVFFKGCPMRCIWCHNPEGMSFLAPKGAEAEEDDFLGRRITADALMKEIEKDTVFYDQSAGGVTFSGGEPLMQPKFLRHILGRCTGNDIHTAVDTCGYADWGVFESIMPVVRLFLFDLKIVDDRRHRQYCGVSNRLVLQNLAGLAENGAKVRIRFPVIPGMTDDDENVCAAAALAKSLPGIERVDILPFHRIADGKYRRLHIENTMEKVPALSRQDVMPVAEQFLACGVSTTVGG